MPPLHPLAHLVYRNAPLDKQLFTGRSHQVFDKAAPGCSQLLAELPIHPPVFLGRFLELALGFLEATLGFFLDFNQLAKQAPNVISCGGHQELLRTGYPILGCPGLKAHMGVGSGGTCPTGEFVRLISAYGRSARRRHDAPLISVALGAAGGDFDPHRQRGEDTITSKPPDTIECESYFWA
jgi:hypothetical protein